MKKTLLTISLSASMLLLGNCAVFQFFSSVSDSVGSVSESLESVSTSLKSISSSINSSSESSMSDDEEKAHRERAYYHDIKELTYIYIGTKNSASDFQKDLHRVARLHGISYPKSIPQTYHAIGAGIKEAGISKSELEIELQDLNDSAKQYVFKGYHS